MQHSNAPEICCRNLSEVVQLIIATLEGEELDELFEYDDVLIYLKREAKGRYNFQIRADVGFELVTAPLLHFLRDYFFTLVSLTPTLQGKSSRIKFPASEVRTFANIRTNESVHIPIRPPTPSERVESLDKMRTILRGLTDGKRLIERFVDRTSNTTHTQSNS